MWRSAAARLSLYGQILINMIAWSLNACVNLVTCNKQHPLEWPPGQDFNIMIMRTLFNVGTYVHWRNFVKLYLMAHPEEQDGMDVVLVPADALGVSGGRDSWWMSLKPGEQQQASPPKASCVLMFMHGGAFMAGEPRMYCAAFKLWMQQLAEQGVAMRVFALGYPLAPEHPFPAAVKAVAAAYTWLVQHLEAEGGADCMILAGDSAGANLVLSALACMRDGTLPDNLAAGISPAQEGTCAQEDEDAAAAAGGGGGGSLQETPLQPPLAAILISPAVDFTSSSVFGQDLTKYLLHQQQQQHEHNHHASKQQPDDSSDGCSNQQQQQLEPVYDYVGVTEARLLAQHYVHATDAAMLADPRVSPVMLQSFAGLVQQKMLVMYGGAEVMSPDITRFVSKVEASGVAVECHKERNQPHCYCMLPMQQLLDKGARVVVPFIAASVLDSKQQCAQSTATVGRKQR